MQPLGAQGERSIGDLGPLAFEWVFEHRAAAVASLTVTEPPSTTSPFGPQQLSVPYVASKKTRAVRGQRASGESPEETRERILWAFSERAKRSGIRAVVMGKLATRLRMSASTLYFHFGSKEDLVTAMVQRWSAELGAEESVIRDMSKTPLERFLLWADAWSRRPAEYAPVFWRDLRHDYGAEWDRLQKDLRRRKAAGAARLLPELRADLHPGVALAVLDVILIRISDPRFRTRLGVSRREAVRTALTIWASGALRTGAVPTLEPRRSKAAARASAKSPSSSA
jgi:AcrR family transcriptional regulator